MDRFTILCTEEQTRKAISLGAPISTTPTDFINNTWFKATAEQMIGWLEQNPRISDIDIYRSGSTYWSFFVTKFCGIIESEKEYLCRKEATLAAIDAALDYLVKAKEEKL